MELLITIGLISMFLLFILPPLHLFTSASLAWQTMMTLEREAQIFFQQFEREVQGAERYEIGEEQLLFFIGEDVIAYQHQDRVIRRQLNQEGHLVMCQYVKQFSVSEESPTLFKVNLTLQMGTETLSTERWLALRAGSRGVREDH